MPSNAIPLRGIDALKAGVCPDCGNPLHHGPWTQEQIDEEAADIGMPASDFVDCCDACFVSDVCNGDVDHAERLLRRELNV